VIGDLTQRGLMLDATVAVVAARGYREARLEEVADRAGVTELALWLEIGGIEDCVAAVFARELERAMAVARSAAAHHEHAVDRACAIVAAVLRHMAAAPEPARVCLVEMRDAGAAGWQRLDEGQDRFADLLGLRHVAPEMPDLAERFVIGGLQHLIVQHLRNDEQTLAQLLEEAITFTVGPYVEPDVVPELTARHLGRSTTASS
jgi:AcrR family transcriptional regulator